MRAAATYQDFYALEHALQVQQVGLQAGLFAEVLLGSVEGSYSLLSTFLEPLYPC